MWPLAQLVGAKRAGSSYVDMGSKLVSFSRCVSLDHVLLRRGTLIKSGLSRALKLHFQLLCQAFFWGLCLLWRINFFFFRNNTKSLLLSPYRSSAILFHLGVRRSETSNVFHIACSLPATLPFASPAEAININFKNLVLTLNGASAVMTKYIYVF